MKNGMGTYGEKKGAYRVFVGKLEGERSVGRPKRRREDNTKMDLQEMEWGLMDWIDQVQDMDRWPVPVNISHLPISFLTLMCYTCAHDRKFKALFKARLQLLLNDQYRDVGLYCFLKNFIFCALQKQ
jgi:hypothetical protein